LSKYLRVHMQIVIYFIFMFALQKLIPLIMGHFPAGTSSNLAAHFAQFILKGTVMVPIIQHTNTRCEWRFPIFNPFRLITDSFGQYDYGRALNLRHYNSTEPPTYNLKSIRVPITLIYGENDILADTAVSSFNYYLHMFLLSLRSLHTIKRQLSLILFNYFFYLNKISFVIVI